MFVCKQFRQNHKSDTAGKSRLFCFAIKFEINIPLTIEGNCTSCVIILTFLWQVAINCTTKQSFHTWQRNEQRCVTHVQTYCASCLLSLLFSDIRATLRTFEKEFHLFCVTVKVAFKFLYQAKRSHTTIKITQKTEKQKRRPLYCTFNLLISDIRAALIKYFWNGISPLLCHFKGCF